MTISTNNSNKKSVMLGLSGGVDSSVAVHLLREQGFEIKAVVFKMSNAHEKTVEDAILAAKSYDIPIFVKDMQQSFYDHVVVPFKNDYYRGATPNPCIMCNPYVKFKALLDAANEHGCDYIATGHYADIVNIDGIYYIKRGSCEKRDQSYMLYRLGQDVLSRLILPLSAYEKTEIRSIAEDIGHISANKPDSQEICFIPDNDYAGYLERHFGVSKKGYFIAPDGKKLCEHKGILHYTVGQRKGLGIALGLPVFVSKIDAESGDIYLSFSGGELSDEITVSNLVFADSAFKQNNETFSCDVKIRSVSKPAKAHVEFLGDDKVKIQFEQPQKAPAKGQSAVFYQDSLVIGGGIIE